MEDGKKGITIRENHDGWRQLLTKIRREQELGVFPVIKREPLQPTNRPNEEVPLENDLRYLEQQLTQLIKKRDYFLEHEKKSHEFFSMIVANIPDLFENPNFSRLKILVQEYREMNEKIGQLRQKITQLKGQLRER